MPQQYEAFIQWLDNCGCAKHGIVRLYQLPLAPLLAGLPAQPWVWCCNFTLKENAAIMHAALTAPPQGAMRVLINKALELKATELVWERVETSGIRDVRFFLT
jgi:hypothetical protein